MLYTNPIIATDSMMNHPNRAFITLSGFMLSVFLFFLGFSLSIIFFALLPVEGETTTQCRADVACVTSNGLLGSAFNRQIRFGK